MGPLLWNIAYDSVLTMPAPANWEVICYADDTIVIVGGRDMDEAIDRADIMINIITRKIRWMGLQVAAKKTEALRFRKEEEKRIRENGAIVIEDRRIELKYSMKYLGMTIRDDWSIREHLEKTAIKAGIVVDKLGRILLNKKGPTEKKRRLYQNVVNSCME